MKLRYLLFLLLIMCLAYSCVGQRIRHPKKLVATSNDCLADSLNRTLLSLQHKADAIITFQYYYDNGSAESVTIFWQTQEKTYAKSFHDCKPLIPVTHLSPDTLFSFYRQQHIADLPEMEIPANAPSHGMAYLIGVYLPGTTRHYNIRETQRNRLIYPNLNDLLPGETLSEPKADPRNLWLNLFEKIMKQ